jgi:uncharacterized coiled-coil protein SlyX
MEMRIEDLEEQLALKREKYDELHKSLMERYEALSDRRDALAGRWKSNSPHSNELDTRCRELLDPVRSAIFDFAKIEEDRMKRIVPLARAMAMVRKSNAKKKLPLLGDLLESIQWDLDVGLFLRIQILERYELAVGNLGAFFDKEFPTVN